MEKNNSLLSCFGLMALFTMVSLAILWIQASRDSVKLYNYRSARANPSKPERIETHRHLNEFSSPEQLSNATEDNIQPNQNKKTQFDFQFRSSHYWRTIDNALHIQLKLFSAYYDTRQGNEVYMLGFENHEANHKYYCIFDYGDEVKCPNEPGKRVRVNDDVDPMPDYHIPLWGFYYVCQLPDSRIPVNASISLNPECKLERQENWIPVQNQAKTGSVRFGACLQGPIYDLDDPQYVVEYVEIMRALGAQVVTMYVQNAGELVWKALKQYNKEGLVELINWNLVFEKGAGDPHYRGQSLLVNDCLYRSIHRVEYLAMLDLDEAILPLGGYKTWNDMIPAIDSDNIGAFEFQHTTFTGHLESVKPEFLTCRPELGSSLKSIKAPKYLSRTQRFSVNGYEKLIVKPRCCKTVSFHRIFHFMHGYHLHKVPLNIGMSFHYREPPLPTRGRAQYDNRLQSLYPELLDKIKERLCALYVP